MKPALRTDGNTATHSAFSNRSLGMPLSGVSMISRKTLAALSDWPISSSRFFGVCAWAMVPTASVRQSTVTVLKIDLM